MQLILASTSRYRAELLHRLQLPFRAVAPDVDETPLPDEAAEALVARLARAKALAVAAIHAGAVVIGSDQVAVDPDGRILGKPHTQDAARRQLAGLAGREARFLTAVAVVGADARVHQTSVDTAVRLRALSADEIDRYLAREPALDCAGSFKSEGLGIALFEWVRSDDPTALIGLPLIALTDLLRAAEVQVLASRVPPP
jgi:septum formation protein